jgi:hypothetical protein
MTEVWWWHPQFSVLLCVAVFLIIQMLQLASHSFLSFARCK